MDTTFADGGRLRTLPSGSLQSIVGGVARLLPDGRFVLIGSRTGGRMYVADRYLVNGTIDASFGTDGRFDIPDAGLNPGNLRDVAVQRDGPW